MAATKISRVFSAIQPTGIPHLGNYLGTLSNWARLQDQLVPPPLAPKPSGAEASSHPLLYAIADLHSYTLPQDPRTIAKQTLAMVASIIACGVDPNRCVLFRQSAIPCHAELAWLLNCITPVGWLHRMTQWKTKMQTRAQPTDVGTERAQSGFEAASDPSTATSKLCLGLFAYPVLQAADIILYRASHVPIGEDQKQHLELTRDIAEMANRQYKTKFFVLPEVLMTPTKRVMSLRDPARKMSKSDPTPNAAIFLTDTDDEIRTKVRKATTDPIDTVSYDPENRPGVANLLQIYASLSPRGLSAKQIAEELFAGKKNQVLKEQTAELIIESTRPVRSELPRLLADHDYLVSCLRKGEEDALRIAVANWNQFKNIVGLSL